MTSTKVLIKLFAYRFYKTHAGLLLFFFVTVLISFFFVNVLNETHLTEQGRIEQNLALTLTFVSSPVFTIFIFAAWLAYMIKSWSFTAAQLRLPQHLFLFYSFNAQLKHLRWTQWLSVQAVIAAPLMAYALFALTVGIIYDHYLLPAVVLLYIAGLLASGASICTALDNLFTDHNAVPWTMNITRHWPRPFFTLPLYHLLHRQKVTLGVTKLLSMAILTAGIFLFPENGADSRIAGIIALGIATAHAFTIYQTRLFTDSYLTFRRNFPDSIGKRLTQNLSALLVLVLPELIWLLYHDTAMRFIAAFVLIAGLMLLFQTLIQPNTSVKKYVAQVFYLFIACFIIILFNLLAVLAPLLFLVAMIRFYRSDREAGR